GHERQRALQDRDEGQPPIGVVRPDPGTELGDLGGDLLLADENLTDVGDEVDPGLGHAAPPGSIAGGSPSDDPSGSRSTSGSPGSPAAAAAAAASRAITAGSRSGMTWPDVPLRASAIASRPNLSIRARKSRA